jgi:hypothetical protein
MHVVGQNDPCIDIKWGFPANLPDSVAEHSDFANQQIVAPVEEIDGEEICATWYAVTTVVSHLANVVSADGPGKANHAGLECNG